MEVADFTPVKMKVSKTEAQKIKAAEAREHREQKALADRAKTHALARKSLNELTACILKLNGEHKEATALRLQKTERYLDRLTGTPLRYLRYVYGVLCDGPAAQRRLAETYLKTVLISVEAALQLREDDPDIASHE